MPTYQNKLVAVLNSSIGLEKALNALAHMAVGLGATIDNRSELRLVDYADADGNSHANISELPFIILKAKNSNQLRTLRTALLRHHIKYVDFTNVMQSIGTAEDHRVSRNVPEDQLQYYGLVIFGDWDTVTALTRRFSLW